MQFLEKAMIAETQKLFKTFEITVYMTLLCSQQLWL